MSQKTPTLWRIIPAIEELQTAWEKKQDLPQFAAYRTAIKDGLNKLQKYYNHIDSMPVYVLSLRKFLLYSIYIVFITIVDTEQ